MTHRNFITWSAAAGLALAAAVPLAALAQDDGTATIAISEKEPFGQYVVDGEGMSLYMLEADTQGGDGAEAVSTCTGECIEEWPVMTATGEPMAGDELDASLLSTIERDDGTMQVTYNGWPLHYYHDDRAPGDTEGQGVHDEWGGWYLLTPSGEPIEDEE
ncbi:COG4315 family predicted lipoprotein [Devosia nitrariae]|uniref:Lipoprotein with Yx(FWY)xxD motif n=1 Tax=Devosia nitrariae TaxID=2071872 RepID=A0ABQ5W4E9_9HYPH|nr:hypothetical protein [Devosia nitrariae]GLQ54742.1 hypothetical protein GCM10010862_20010 [Devosia nitrariae]